MPILAISGSLRQRSANGALLDRVARLAEGATSIALWNGLASIPPFNPDMADAPAVEVKALQLAVRNSSAVLISSPEYAHGVAGALKNALDWLVGSGDLYDKPVALVNVSARATYGQAALAETLRTMGATPVLDIHIPATVESCTAGEVDAPLLSLIERIARAIP